MSALGGTLEGLRILDLFAGSGALGLEALSRGAAEAVFVDHARSSIRVLESNVELLDARPLCRIIQRDVMRFIRGLQASSFDLALADPPYDHGLARQLVERFAEEPFAQELWVEHRSSESLPTLPGLRQRHYGDTTITTSLADA